MINIIENVDLYDHIGEYDVVLVGTNTYCTMSQGFQLKVMLNYPYVYDANLATKYGDRRKLGTILDIGNNTSPQFCICFISHGYNFRPDLKKEYVSYEALEECLRLINTKYKGKCIATTLMGVSEYEGNGDRERILQLFTDILTDVNVTVYDYLQLSRSEEVKKTYKAEQKLKRKDKDAYYQAVAKRKKEAEERYRKNGHRRY